MSVAILAARDDAGAVGGDEDLLDDAFPGRLGRQYLPGDRVEVLKQ